MVARAGTAVFGARRSAVWLADAKTGVLQLGAGAADLPAPAWPADLTVEPRPGPDADRGRRARPRRAGPGAQRRAAAGPDELSLLKTLGRQAGQAMERAMLYDEQRSVATTLQHSLLPRTLPDDPRLGLSACYRPAVEGLEVGGDWYDAFLLDADRVAVVVGDVVGRAWPPQPRWDSCAVRCGLWPASTPGPPACSPGWTGSSTGSRPRETATLAYAELDLRDGRVRYACAGHPPPVLVDPTGRAVLLWGAGRRRWRPFGGDASEAEATLVPGARLAVYTDGLVERRDEPLDAASTGWSADGRVGPHPLTRPTGSPRGCSAPAEPVTTCACCAGFPRLKLLGPPTDHSAGAPTTRSQSAARRPGRDVGQRGQDRAGLVGPARDVGAGPRPSPGGRAAGRAPRRARVVGQVGREQLGSRASAGSVERRRMQHRQGGRRPRAGRCRGSCRTRRSR